MIEGEISRNTINTYMKCGNIPLWWRNLFLYIVNIRDYISNYCNRAYGLVEHCLEWYLYNLLKNNENNQDEIAEYAMYWGNW